MSEQSEELIFAHALEKTPEERAGYLDHACAGKPELRMAVESLLDAYQHGAYLEPREVAMIDFVSLADETGKRIGPYTLLEKIGEGGMGIVYLAEQRCPIKRRVALKIIKLGMDTKQVVARFEAERQALAMMDHPNIAKVLDAGATGTGRPYFVMELVRGIRITEYCDQNRLSTRERLELFTQICQAVQHAHQKGIIHRDIKPSNILVTLHDGVPVPKVIDFGIAKATQAELTEKTLVTQFHQMIGTPAYMSPEQAEMSGLDIDTRSDIYSLGVLLYELVTGRTPLDDLTLMESGIDEIRRRIREEEPAKPSTRLSTLAAVEQDTVAKHRRTDPARLRGFCRGDLDWIVMRALEKDRTRRYDTAKGLANDVQRYLNREPVEAAAPSLGYRSGKFITRHRTAVATVILVTMALVVGTAVSVWQAVRATRAHQLAVAAFDTAQQSEQRAKEEALAARRNLYASDMLLVKQAIDASEFRRAHGLLERHRPTEGGTADDIRGWEWHWLRSQLHTNGGTLLATMPGAVFGLDISSDGRYLAASTSSGALKVFETSTGREIVTIDKGTSRLPKKPVFLKGEHRFIFNQMDREKILTNGYLKIWNVDAEEVDYVFRYHRSTGPKVVSPDGTKVLFNALDHAVHMLDLDSHSILWTTPVVTLTPQFIFSRPSDEEYLIGDADGEIRFYSTVNGNPTRRIQAHSGRIENVNISPDGRLVASTGFGEPNIKLWDYKTLTLVGVLQGHQNEVNDVEFTSDSRRLVSSSSDETVRVWDVESRNQLALYRGLEKFWEVAWTPDDRFIIAGGDHGSIRVWDTNTREARASPILTRHIQRCAMSADGTRLALQGQDGSLKLGELGENIDLKDAVFAGTKNTCVSLSPDGRLLIAGKQDGSVSVYDVASEEEVHSLPVFESEVVRAEMIHANKAILACDLDCNLALVQPDSAAGTVIWRDSVEEAFWHRYALAVSPNGRLAALGNWFGTIILVDLRTGQTVRWEENPSTEWPIRDLAFSPDGQTLATVDPSGVVRLWDVATLELRAALEGHRDTSDTVIFLPGGDRLVSGGNGEDSVMIWDLVTRQELLRLSVDARIIHLEFSPQQNVLLGLAEWGTLYAWRAPP